jgi:hypothetical protein
MRQPWYPKRRLGECEGECQRHADCERGLMCFRQQKQQGGGVLKKNVPGCNGSSGSSSGSGNLCYRHPPGHVALVGQGNRPQTTFPLGACEGHSLQIPTAIPAYDVLIVPPHHKLPKVQMVIFLVAPELKTRKATTVAPSHMYRVI